MVRNWFAKATVALLTIGILAGCAGAQKEAPGGAGTPTPPPAEKKFKVAMVTDTGGINDESFNASAWAGLTKAKNELGFDIKYVESRRQEDYEPNYQTMADQGMNLMWGIGFLMVDATDKMAAKLPNQKFGIIDNVVNKPNVASVVFKEEEGSFLMGVIAAKTTKTKKIGFIGGLDIPVIHHFEAGFKAGVMAADPSAQVNVVYANSFTDPGKGKEVALSMYRDGADVIFHASGNTGNGAIEAAKEQNKFIIGVDQDQNKLAPQHVISSMMKRVDVAVFEISKLTQQDKFPGGQTTTLGLKEDGVGYSASTLWDKMPAGTKAEVDKWADAIKTGKVTVPNDRDKLKNWTVPKL